MAHKKKKTHALGAFFLFFAFLQIFIFPFKIRQTTYILMDTLSKQTNMLATNRSKGNMGIYIYIYIQS